MLASPAVKASPPESGNGTHNIAVAVRDGNQMNSCRGHSNSIVSKGLEKVKQGAVFLRIGRRFVGTVTIILVYQSLSRNWPSEAAILT
jgi:hypothetical protein